MSKVIVFDLWDTLGTKNMSVSGVLFDKFDIVNDDGVLRRYEAAVQLRDWSSMEEMAKAFLVAFDRPKSKANVAFVVATFERAIRQAVLFPGMGSLLSRLRQQGRRLAVLSNTTVFESAVLRKWDMEDWFNVRIFSWETGLLKPNRAAFEVVLSVFDVEPNDVIFVDDSYHNTKAADAFGFRAIKFDGHDKCRERLGDWNVLPFSRHQAPEPTP